MSDKCINKDEKKKLDNEFSEFLIARISQAGGSLHFQHLSVLIQQARFEIRDMFGTTKSELMKFLNGHPEIFKKDSNGVISLITSSPSNDNTNNIIINKNNKSKNTVSEIENGVGKIIKMHPEFGIIKAFEPIETLVHFKSESFNNNKDSLLSDSCLEVGDEVFFNAVHGHKDFDIQFRASKVWLKLDGTAKSDLKRHNEQFALNNISGVGVIQKVHPDFGFLSVSDNKKTEIYFSKSCIKNCVNTDLTAIFKVNDPVEFSACRTTKKDVKFQWEATSVKKVSKHKSSHTSSHTETEVSIKTKIENEKGKICTHAHGAIIKFGKNFSERADGDSSLYFLYGAEVLVTDIAFEFSDGDDVHFNAIRTKSAPGWKATLVWVGEKPSGVSNRLIEKEMDNFSEENYSESSDVSVHSINSYPRSKKGKNVFQNHASLAEQLMQPKKVSSKFSVSANFNENQKQNFKVPKIFPHPSVQKSKKKNTNLHEAEKFSLNNLKGNKHFTVSSKRKEKFKAEKKKPPVNANVNAKFLCLDKPKKISNLDYEYQGHHQLDSDDVSEISEKSFEDEHIQNKRGFLVETLDGHLASSSKYDFSDSDENSSYNLDNEKKKLEQNSNQKASIKRFEDIDGEIIDLYCKAAIIRSSLLQKNVDFVLNAFYLNGKSVEEQQVIDLKEIIKPGDIVKFNCFEIIDDFGEIHQKVTMAWKGPKPKVYEMTPEEFITEYELSVNVSEDLEPKDTTPQKTASRDSLASLYNEENITPQKSASPDSLASLYNEDEDSEKESSDSIFNSFSDNEEIDDSKLSETEICQASYKHKYLSEKVLQQLKNKGLISADLELDFCSVMDKVINSVQQHYVTSNSDFSTLNGNAEDNFKCISSQVCVPCLRRKEAISAAKSKREKCVQTIITGGIDAQNESYLRKKQNSEKYL